MGLFSELKNKIHMEKMGKKKKYLKGMKYNDSHTIYIDGINVYCECN